MKRFIALVLSLVMALSLCAPAWAAGGKLSGEGSAEKPFIIEDAADLTAISDKYDTYAYYKVADGVETLDLTGVGRINLNGSFDGNGVTLNNLTTALFQTVGKVGVAQDIKISNLTANVNNTDGRALVRNIFNPGETTFENVTMHGYIEGEYNIGSFYNYGTANADDIGADYTVSFVNAKSNVTLVCTTGNAIGGMLGHGYEGAENTLTINMDENSGYTGQMYTTGTAKCYEVMAMCSHTTYILNGVETSRYTNEYSSTKLNAVAPTEGADGYYVAPAAGVDHYVVYVNAQMTAYDETGVKIPNKAGLTWSLDKETITSGLDGKILDLVTSAEIVNDANHEIGYELNNGLLTIYTSRDWNYASGWITLNVNQYDADGKILATGNLEVYRFAEPEEFYTVSFDANGGSGEMSSLARTDAVKFTLPENGFTAPAGKYFKGWATSADGVVITDTLYAVTGNETLYAIWEDLTYNVTFNANGGTGVLTQAPVPAGQFTLPTEHPFTREGYTFVGWATDKNATKVLGTTYNVTGDVTFYAIWEEEECMGDSHVKVLVEYSGDKATKVYCDYCGMTFAFIQGTEDDAKDKFGEGNYVNAENDVWYTLKAQSGEVPSVPEIPPVKDEVVTVPKVEVVAPEVTVKIDTSDAMTPEQEEAVQKAADEVAEKLVVSDAVKVEEQKLADAAAEIATDTADKVETIVTDKHVDALDKLIENETVKREDVVLAVQTYVDIQVSEIEVNTEDSDTTVKTVTLNITPMYQLVATTEKVLTDPNTKIDTDKDSGNAVKVGDPKPMMVETMEVTIPLPSVFADKLVYILHEAAKGDVIYTATADADGNVTFTTKSGFSPFTFSMNEIAVGAEVEGGDSYANLQSAVNYAGKNAVITVKKANQSAVVSGETTFTLKYEGEANKNNTKITVNGKAYLAKKTVNDDGSITYVFKTYIAGGYAPSTTPEKVVTSADTFDAGIALYVGMSVMAAAGSAVVLKKRED